MSRYQLSGIILLWAALGSSPAFAQSPAEFTAMFSWMEVYAGTTTPVAHPNGVLEPGESALLTLGVSFTPVGTIVQYHDPLPGGTAPVAGFRGTGFGIVATDAGPGVWAYGGGRWPGGIGAPYNHGLGWTTASQPWPPAGALPDPVNPIPDLWKALWTPDSYDPRQVRFDLNLSQLLGGGNGHLYVVYGTDPVTGNPLVGAARAWANSPPGVTIPTVPAPGAAPVLLTLCACLRRRRPS
jgi:hypothetical protein